MTHITLYDTTQSSYETLMTDLSTEHINYKKQTTRYKYTHYYHTVHYYLYSFPTFYIAQFYISRNVERVTSHNYCAKKTVTTMLTYPWKCTVLHCNQSVGSSAPVVSRCFPGGYNVKLYISKGRLAWWLLAFLCCVKMC